MNICPQYQNTPCNPEQCKGTCVQIIDTTEELQWLMLEWVRYCLEEKE
jgi:hypothetical protein